MIEIMMNLQGGAKAPLYEKIYEYIKSEITDGRIPRGERLPSTRLLAKNLAVSRSTVEMAYDQLLAEGYIQAEPCRGFFVCDIAELYRLRGSSVGDTGQVHRPEKPVCLVDFSPYAIDTRSFPYNVWRKISRNVLLDDSEELLMAGDGQGEYSLRSEIADYLHHARGVNCRPENIVLGAGNEYLEILLTQLLGGNKTVLMENPGYPQAYHTFRNMGYRVVTVPADEQGLSGGTVRAAAPELVYMMPSHQFPTGSVMPLGRRLELLAWAAEQEERYLIEDDHDSEYRYRGKPIPSLQSVDGLGKVIYLGTFSKSIAPALRISYMVLPKRLLKKYHENCGFYASTVAKVQQEVLARFMREGYFERHLNRMRGIYRAKHDRMSQELKKQTWVHKIYGDNAGLHFLVEVETKASEEELVETGKAHGIRLYGLSANYIGKREGRGWPTLLIGYGSLPEDEMKESVRCITDVIKQIEEKNKKI